MSATGDFQSLRDLIQSIEDGTYWETVSPEIKQAAAEAVERMKNAPPMTEEEAIAAAVAFIMDERFGGP